MNLGCCCADHPGLDAWGDDCAANEGFCNSPIPSYADPNDKMAAECTNADNRAGCTMLIANACPCTCGKCVCGSPSDKERTPGYGCRQPIA